jgi:hypothetical protein
MVPRSVTLGGADSPLKKQFNAKPQSTVETAKEKLAEMAAQMTSDYAESNKVIKTAGIKMEE